MGAPIYGVTLLSRTSRAVPTLPSTNDCVEQLAPEFSHDTNVMTRSMVDLWSVSLKKVRFLVVFWLLVAHLQTNLLRRLFSD